MNEQILFSKLSSLKRCVDRIEIKTPSTPAQLLADVDSQDIIALNLQRAVQLCVDIASHIVADLNVRPPMTMAESFDCLHQAGILSPGLLNRMKKSVGFRNIAVHDYFAIDWNICTRSAKARKLAKHSLPQTKAWTKTSDGVLFLGGQSPRKNSRCCAP
jgi:uncharacterized protein YutE (UPF0331/DUF86 family)